ncbi:Coenzyme F420 hydrogenase/dehydrogenase, beta subunit C-terminal domain [Collinsella ihumii]|uniref:Coenzyme F420 hydrogenase/dehydrogenase, beta subunit C-terminal domain n=1 Tax=Collinsella ihumii TaxID=1720204 RepID=A0ABT7XH63_9ACTN|nr:Coenzyme F420 hydrogenase/dehydrogenase, beta subunit C-terminal domain [Collinsella ihumii]MDN0064724.1 Coenzyme F420 hydrogenase/dehydrogenase, beta subunit C-terminal domain [Collinsella ihumii]
METRDLWAKPANCCGCGACAAHCPKGAISMEESPEGFVYPRIDAGLCVGCGLCRKACGLQNRYAQETSGPWYAACYRGDSSLSASAGAFYGLARSVVDGGGAVFGAAYVRDDDGLHVRHVMAEDPEGLSALQGSKYVQSDAGSCFPEVKRRLESGGEVLFSGTPCQVAGLRGYLGRDWPNLVTVDLVCHGVPSEAMFRSLVASIERQQSKRVVDFRFRCKRSGWGHSLLLLLLRPLDAADSSRDEEVFIPAHDFAYYDLFLNLKTLRDSCYSCPFSGPLRPADITVGDFWGVQHSRPDVLEGGRFDLERGVSCVLVNTERGKKSLMRHGSGLDLFEVSFGDIAKGNDQLRHPSELPEDRDAYLDAYRNSGWGEVETLWRGRERGTAYRIKRIAQSIVPKKIRNIIKRLLRQA